LFDGVVLATHPRHTARLLEQVDPELGERLQQIEYASSAVTTLVYPRSEVEHPLDGFGVVVPAIEGRPIVAASFLTVKFPHTAPKDRTVIRVFSGGVLHPELVDRSDEELIALARQQLVDLIGVQGEPVQTYVTRWRDSMPQYHVGHLSLLAEIERLVAAHDGLELAGGGYRGVGIPQCIRSGREAAERLAAQLQSRPAQRAQPIKRI
jgi:oxygen-dependent protoporphyrinogen oxidase